MQLSIFQLRLSDLHGDSNSVWYEVLGDTERGTSRPGDKELSRRSQVHHQNIRLRRLSQRLQLRLLPDERRYSTADPLDGLGGRSTGMNSDHLVCSVKLIDRNACTC